MNPWVIRFFNLTAGLEKFIIAVLAAFQAYIGSLPAETLSDAQKTLYIALLAAVQIMYTESSTRKPTDVPAPSAADEKDKK